MDTLRFDLPKPPVLVAVVDDFSAGTCQQVKHSGVNSYTRVWAITVSGVVLGDFTFDHISWRQGQFIRLLRGVRMLSLNNQFFAHVAELSCWIGWIPAPGMCV